MNRHLYGLAAAFAVAVFAAACADAPPTAPQAGDPSFVKAPSPYACAFTGNPSLSSAINGYFVSTADRKKATDLAALLQTAYNSVVAPNYTAAKGPGFDLLAFVGETSRTTGAGSSPAAGAAVVQQTIQCMFDVPNSLGTTGEFFGWPTADQFNFAWALDVAQGGAFYVRGGSSKDPAFANLADENGTVSVAGNLSVFSPPTDHLAVFPVPDTAKVSWSSILQNTTRVLIYGNTLAEGYDWKLIPRNTAFSPSVTIALCQGLGTDFTSADMINQSGVGVLGYVDVNYLCGTTPTVASAGFRGMLMHQFARVGSLLAPAPLYASANLAVSTIGGSASGAKGDAFTGKTVGAVELTLTIETFQKTLKVNTGDLGTITVKVQTPAPEHSPVGGVTVTLSAVNNNGFTQVGEIVGGTCVPVKPKTTTATIGQGGTTAVTAVSWSHGCITKTGIVNINANSAAQGRTGGIGSASSLKFNVKP